MDEVLWLTSTDPAMMLRFLTESSFGPIGLIREDAGIATPSGRKLRLFACACCLASWNVLRGKDVCRAIETAEAHADGMASIGQVQAACEIIPPGSGTSEAVIAHNEVRMFCWQADIAAMRIAEPGHAIPPEQKAALLRDIIGNPWKPVTLVPSWLTPPVLALARSAYESRDFGALPVLWDALSEAGCQEERIRLHCLEPLHVRGCWCVDLILRKT